MITGRLLAKLGILFYILFTLLPDSSTQVLQFPWVLIAQVGLGCFAIAGLLNIWRKSIPFYLLGNGLDWAIAGLFIALSLSTIFATFPAQALWNSLIAFAFFVAIYVTHNYLHSGSKNLSASPTTDRGQARSPLQWLLTFQGVLNVGFILESLCLWSLQTFLPKLSELNQINLLGLNLTYDFSDIESRNGSPLGHQNYVAGYLMLALPLLIGLAIAQKGWWRKFWIAGIVLGAIDLYTTNSRGGSIGLVLFLVFGALVLVLRSSLNRWLVLFTGGGAIAVAGGLIALNPRLQASVVSLVNLPSHFNLQSFKGSSELFFRAIAAYTGWQIGLDHWLFGAGVGSAPLLYQQYRPSWAGREAEIMFQLHSTPVQLWAELGTVGIVAVLILLVAAISLFAKFHFSRTWHANAEAQIYTYSLFGSLLAYGAIAITDYQLDVLAIAGSLTIVFASLAYLGQIHTKDLVVLGNYRLPRLWLSWVSTAYLIGAIAWLAPVNFAWLSSNTGFIYLSKARADLEANRSDAAITNLAQFQQKLEQAYSLTSWEPYYAYQLGWNLADIGLQNPTLPQAKELQQQSLAWLRKGIAANPNNEFGYNTAAWLSLAESAYPQAEQFFRRSLELVPAKRSLSFGLGVSLLRQGKMEQGIQAIAHEALNDPIFMTSPRWTEPQWQPLYPKAMAELDRLYDRMLKSSPNPSLQASLQLSRAALHWWSGNVSGSNELKATGNPTAVLLAEAIPLGMNPTTTSTTTSTPNQNPQLDKIKQNPQTPAEMVVSAWLNPNLRLKLLEKAYAFATRSLPDQSSALIVQALSDRMDRSPSLDAWLRQPLAVDSPLQLRPRRARENFGIISRHIDGPIPLDFSSIQENAIVSTFFTDLFPTQGTL
ncbi:O-antigen ligase family protein [Tumidithrix elongata RA019]|uniref:O-antigen ligase family protein n=1 Tax=Tumidithrix elongata BACA0141 TaxID=2716417 RepID=A0AAW9Q5G9_9CYAN|nr:O-antigen ligase family protein [Tumidithrix elongata RA019]